MENLARLQANVLHYKRIAHHETYILISCSDQKEYIDQGYCDQCVAAEVSCDP